MPDIDHGQSDPVIDHGQSDVESLARKLRGLESQLTGSERRLLERILAAAVVSGIILGAAPVDSAGSGAAATQAAEGTDSIRAQFTDAFTPGEEWISHAAGDIGMIK